MFLIYLKIVQYLFVWRRSEMWLLLHNYTISDMKSPNVDCYVFTERDANCKAEIYASCLHDYITKKVEAHPETKRVVMFSDNCTGQNKNQLLSNVLLSIAIRYSITIEHHYLVVGHTHLSCDTFHSAVEVRTRDIDQHTVGDYIHSIKTALPGVPGANIYIHKVDWTFFKSFQLSMVNSIRPGSGRGAPTVQSVRAFRYNSSGTIDYKLLVDDDFSNLPQKVTIPAEFPEALPFFSHSLSIGANKLQHMLDLMEYIPVEKREEYKRDFLDEE